MTFNIPAEHKHASGVYVIRNSVNAKVYVGSAVNFRKRYQGHRSHLLNGKHSSKHLQRHCDKHGFDTLSFCLLELTDTSPEALREAEQRHLEAFDAANPERGFCNMPQVFPAARHSPETKAKLGELLTSYMTPEMREKRLVRQKEASAKRTAKRMARRVTCETCGSEFMPKLWKATGKAKFCSQECVNRRTITEETRAKQREKSAGRKRSAESIERGRQKQLGRGDMRSAAGIERQRVSVKNRVKTEETKERERATLARPEVVAKRIAALKAKGPWNKSPDSARERTCQHCKTTFLVDWPKQKRAYCSRTCFLQDEAKPAPGNKLVKTERTCQQCGAGFLSLPSIERKVCSRACQYELRKANTRAKSQPPAPA